MKKTLTAVIAAITVLLTLSTAQAFKSIGGIVTFDKVIKIEKTVFEDPTRVYCPYSPLTKPDLMISNVQIKDAYCDGNSYFMDVVVTVQNRGGLRGVTRNTRVATMASISPDFHSVGSDLDQYFSPPFYSPFPSPCKTVKMTHTFEIDRLHSYEGQTAINVTVLPLSIESNIYNNTTTIQPPSGLFDCVSGEELCGWEDYAPNPRFAVQSDMVLDKETGLIWDRSPSAEQMASWASALAYASDSSVGNHDGWRLPTEEEFSNFVDTTQEDPALPMNHPFDNVQGQQGWYWTSTTDANNLDKAFYMDMYDGQTYSFSKNGNRGLAWCVRELGENDMCGLD